jgi:hypothetical protein
VRKDHRAEHFFLGQFLGFRSTIITAFGCGHDEVEAARGFTQRRVELVFAILEADARRRSGP